MESVITAVVTGAPTLVSVLVSNSRGRAQIEAKLDELSARVDKHNRLIERAYALEQDVAVLKHNVEQMGDYARKDDFNFISCIRLPDFVTREDFDWAVSEAAAKKKLDFSAVELLRVDEGLCVQCMHTGPYDDEPATIDAMRTFAAEQGYAPDFSEARLHHEIYLSDPRKCVPEKLKTVIRHPIKLI